MPLQMDQDDADLLGRGMAVGGSVELPFAVPYVYWVNGNARLRAAGGVQYFGGWATDQEAMLEAGQDRGLTEQPAGWNAEEIITEAQKTLKVFTSRGAFVAPIDIRHSWFMKEAGENARRASQYFPGSRQHIQALVFLAGKFKGEPMKPWGPAVLSAKGYQAGYLNKSFQTWASKISAVRKRVAPKIPAWCFYMALGTFGNDVKVVKVGKGTNEKPITPINVYVPEALTDAQLEGLFVGKENAHLMAGLKLDAADWLVAWANRGEGEGSGSVEPSIAEEPTIEEPEGPPDEIPF